MQPRRMLFAAVVIVAAATAATWVVSQPPRKFGAAPVDVASVENAASAAAEPHAAQPRRGAGTIGARAGSLGAVAAPGEYRPRASQRGDAGAGQRRSRPPRPSPLPGVDPQSTGAQPENADAPGALAWFGQGVEVIPPPTPGRDPRDQESVRESDPPPDPATIASGFPPSQPPPAPRTESPPAPRGETPRAESPSDPGGSDPVGPLETPSDPGESITTDAPLSPEQIDNRADQQLAGLPPEQADPLKPIVVQQITVNANQAFGWTTPAPTP